FRASHGAPHPHIGGECLPLTSAVVGGQEFRFDKLVEPVQVDIGEDWATNSALRRAAERREVAPFLQISGLKQSVDQPEEPVVVNLLGKNPMHDRMVEPVKTLGDVSLDEPYCAGPAALDFLQRRVTSPTWP